MSGISYMFRTISLFGTILTGSLIGDYITTPNVNGAELIKQQAAIIQEYSGPSPQEALDNMQATLNVVKIQNPDYQSEIQGLEVMVDGVKSQLLEMDSSQVSYTMDTLGSTLEDYANDHYKNPIYLTAGVISGVVGLGAGIASAATDDD